MKILFFIIVLLFLVSCSTVDQQQAEDIALKFVSSRVVFYAKQNETAQTVQDYSAKVVASNKVEDNWLVSVQVSSLVNGTQKQTVLPLVIDSRTGEVIEFNNRPVPQQ